METALFGKDIDWKAIEDQYFRIITFTPLASVENGEVKAIDHTSPYGLLTLEAPILNCEGMIAIGHKLDYLNVWRIYNERGVSDDEEVLVVYSPVKGMMKMFASVQPKLVFLVYPKGYMERIYDPAQSAEAIEEQPLAALHGLKGQL